MTEKTRIGAPGVAPGRKRYLVKTEGSDYLLTIFEDRGKYVALLQGKSRAQDALIDVRDTSPLAGRRSLIHSPPSTWVGECLQIASVTTSPVREVHDLDSGASLRATINPDDLREPNFARSAKPPVQRSPEPPQVSIRPSPLQPALTKQKSEMDEELRRLREENERLKRGTTLKVSEKGAVSVYGLGRFPVTLYQEQWTKLLEFEKDIRQFIRENKGRLK